MFTVTVNVVVTVTVVKHYALSHRCKTVAIRALGCSLSAQLKLGVMSEVHMFLKLH